jgi:hypothetical protein
MGSPHLDDAQRALLPRWNLTVDEELVGQSGDQLIFTCMTMLVGLLVSGWHFGADTNFIIQNYISAPLSGFSTAGSKFLLIVRRARMVSAGDNGIYTGSGLRRVIPYIQCVAVVFLSQVCSW